MKLNKVSRMLFSLAALMLGGVLQNATGMQLFFWLGMHYPFRELPDRIPHRKSDCGNGL